MADDLSDGIKIQADYSCVTLMENNDENNKVGNSVSSIENPQVLGLVFKRLGLCGPFLHGPLGFNGLKPTKALWWRVMKETSDKKKKNRGHKCSLAL